MAVTQDPNEQNFINTSLAAITSKTVDAPHTGSIPPTPSTVTGFYATRQNLNTTTGQTENDTALILN